MPSLPPPSARPPPLRASARAAGARTFHVVLVEPEIPPNTGNIARLCGATRCPLHLVGKLGFHTDDKAVRRAGLDYWHLVDVRHHTDLDAAEAVIAAAASEAENASCAEDAPGPPGSAPRSWLFTGRASRSYLDVAFRRGDALVFGRESTGLPDALIESRPASTVAIPTLGEVRSLNLANSVAIGVYEALRQVGALALGDPAPSGSTSSSSSFESG